MRLSSLFDGAHENLHAKILNENQEPLILYDPVIHGTLEEFYTSDANRNLRQQLKINIDELRQFLLDNGRGGGADRFSRYWDRVENWHLNRSDAENEHMYTSGARSLRSLAHLSRDETIPILTRVDKLDNLSIDLGVCPNAGGENMSDAVTDIALNRTGFANHAVNHILEKSKACVLDFVKETFEPEANNRHRMDVYQQWESHLRNLFRTEVASQFWGPQRDDSASEAKVLFSVTDAHREECARRHDELVNARSLVTDLAAECLTTVQSEYRHLIDKQITVEELCKLIEPFKHEIQPQLTERYGNIRFDDVFSSHYLSRFDQDDALEHRGLISDRAVLERIIADNLAAAGVLVDYTTAPLARDSNNEEVLEESGGYIRLIHNPRLRELRAVEIQDLDWIQNHWLQADESSIYNLARSVAEKKIDRRLTDAIQAGESNRIRQFSRLIRPLKTELRAKLLEAIVDDTGAPALFEAMRAGHVDAVRAYTAAVRSLPAELQVALLSTSRTEFLEADTVRVEAGVGTALVAGRADVIEAYAGGLRDLSPEQRARLISPTNGRGESFLALALKRGRTEDAGGNTPESIRAYGALLRQLPPSDRARYVAGSCLDEQDSQFRPGLYYALKGGHAEAIRAYSDLLSTFSPDQIANCLFSGEDANGASGLALAIENGHAKAVRAYTDSMRSLSDVAQGRLLEAGAGGLATAVRKGDADTIRAYTSAISILDVTTRVRMLNHGAAGLVDAVRAGHWQSVEAYCDALIDLPLEQRGGLLQVDNPSLRAALAGRLKAGDRHTVDAYFQGADPVDPTTSAIFTKAADALAGKDLAAAFNNNDGEYVRRYISLVKGLRLAHDAPIDLLKAPGCIQRGIERGHNEVISNYISSIAELGPKAQDHLFAEGFQDRSPQTYLGKALAYGDANIVEAYIASLRPLDSEVRGKYLTPGCDLRGISDLARCLERGYHAPVRSYVQAVASLEHPGAHDLQIGILEARRQDVLSDSDDPLRFRGRLFRNEIMGVGHAIRGGSFRTVAAYLAGLSPLDPELRTRLACSRQSNGEPAICIALENGDARLVRAFADNTKYLDYDIYLNMLSGADGVGNSKLFRALAERNEGRTRSCIKAFAELDPETTVKLLAANDGQGRSFLSRAFDQGSVADLKFYVKSMASRPPAELKHVLAARDATGKTGLTRAVLANHAAVALGFPDAIGSFATPLQAELLAGRDLEGQTTLAHILCGPKPEHLEDNSNQRAPPPSRSEKIELYQNVIENLPSSIRKDILLCKDEYGTPFLVCAAEEGDYEKAKCYVELVMRQPVLERLPLLEEMSDFGKSALECAQEGGHEEIVNLLASTIKATRKIVTASDREAAAAATLDPAREPSQASANRAPRRQRQDDPDDRAMEIHLTGSDDAGRRVRARLNDRSRSPESAHQSR